MEKQLRGVPLKMQDNYQFFTLNEKNKIFIGSLLSVYLFVCLTDMMAPFLRYG